MQQHQWNLFKKFEETIGSYPVKNPPERSLSITSTALAPLMCSVYTYSLPVLFRHLGPPRQMSSFSFKLKFPGFQDAETVPGEQMTPTPAPGPPVPWCGSPAAAQRICRCCGRGPRQRLRKRRRRRYWTPFFAHCRVRVDEHADASADTTAGSVFPALDWASRAFCPAQKHLSHAVKTVFFLPSK